MKLKMTALALALSTGLLAIGGSTTVTAKGKPGGSTPSTGSSSLELQLLNDTGNPGVSLGDLATFTVDTGAEKSWVTANCYQGTTLVYTQTHGFYPDYPWAQEYQFGPTVAWVEGAASCSAELFTAVRRKHVTLTTISFDVAG